MTVKIFFTMILLVCFQVSFTQKLKLGDVTIKELKQNVHPKDSSAAAAYLFKKGTTEFSVNAKGSWEITTKVSVKIKIYNKEGFNYANQEIAYYVGGGIKEEIYIYDAYTYNLVENKIEKTKLKSESEFKEKVNDSWNLKKITFPSVKEGSIIEFSYKIISPHISSFNDWYFQYEIPVDIVQNEIYIPQYFRYRTEIKGFNPIKTEEKLLAGIDFSTTKYTYSAVDVPAIKSEEFVKNIKNFTSVLKFELASIHYPSQPIKNVAIDWKDVSKSIYEIDSFGRELNFKSYFEEDISQLLLDNPKEAEQVQRIFDFVQSRMHWNGNVSYMSELGVKKAYKEKTGNSADINLMLVAMLRYAGLEANPIITSTRSNGVAIFPSRFAYNYVIAGVKLNANGETLFLDATSKNTVPNILPIKVLNWSGRILISSEASQEIAIQPKKHSTKNYTILAEIVDEKIIKGKVREVSNEYFALLFREKDGLLTNKSLIEKLESKYDGISVSALEVQNEKSKPVTVTYTFENNNLLENIGDKVYFSPLLFMAMTDNPFKSEKRDYPIEFDFPQSNNFNISIKVPKNYEVESFPSSVNYRNQDGSLGFNFNSSISDNVIQISATFKINNLLIAAEDYGDLKTFFKEIINKQTEKIVLKNKE